MLACARIEPLRDEEGGIVTQGDGHTLYPEVLPECADFVMYWWHKAALLVRERKAERLGFITTNSLRQTINRRVLETAPTFPRVQDSCVRK